MSTVLVIPDMHIPFHHKDTLEFLKRVKKKYNPNKFICLGDEADYHGLGNYDHDPDGRSAGDEHSELLKHLIPFYKEFPTMDVCTSNHTSRPFRMAYKHGIPKAFMRDYKDFLQAPKGWNWKDSFEIDGVIFEHGEAFSGRNGAIKSAEANMQSTVIGHLHSHAGIQYLANDKHLIFGFNVGCLIDRHEYAFNYGKHFKNKPILGCGIISEGIPTFIPMLLTSKGKWVGKL